MTPTFVTDRDCGDESPDIETPADRVARWPVTHLSDVVDGVDYFRHAWNTEFGSCRTTLSPHEAMMVHATTGVTYLCVVTGGWSENEALLAGMHRNRLLWSMTWRLSTAGGLHIFRYPRLVEDAI